LFRDITTVRVYSAAEVHAALPWPALAQALARAFVAGASVPVRHAHKLSAEDSLLLMPAWNDELIITKLVTVMPTAAHTVQASLLVCQRSTGRPLALMDGEAITLRRTAAVSALAAQHLARPDATRLLIVGTGRLAAWMARAHAALRPGLTQLRVWGRNAQAAQQLAGLLADEGLPAQAVSDLSVATAQAHIVCCATTASSPIVQGAWLSSGTHLDLVGAFKPSMREVDDTAVQRARVVVDTYAGALAEAGDLLQPLASGVISRSHIQAELAELLSDAYKNGTGRCADSDITLFKSVGTALEDLAAAQAVLAATMKS
jgi:ornithine cyclodeaminase/alanine dehydrogenase-like protein (mu-crystallin family)